MDFVVVVANVFLNAFIQFKTIIGWIEVNVIVFQRSPEPFDPYIVQGSSLAVHRDLYPLGLEVLGPEGTGVLAALVRVQDLRFTVRSNGFLQDFPAPGGGQRVADAPSDDFTAVYIHDCSQIHKAVTHRDVGDIRTTDLIRAGYCQTFQQIRFNEHLHAGLGQVFPPVDRLPSHDLQQAPDSLGTNRIVFCDQEQHN